MAKSVVVVNDFPGSCVGQWSIADSELKVGLFREPLAEADGMSSNYNVHFVFGIRNASSQEIDLHVEVSACPPIRRPFPISLFISDDPNEEFVNAGYKVMSDGCQWHAFSLRLCSGEIKYVSNTQWRPYAYVARLFDRLAEKAGFQRMVFGESVEGRELVAYLSPGLSEPIGGRPTLLISSGFHPMEPDTWGCEAILEGLCRDGSRGILEKVNVIMVPMVNPDGFVLGLNGSNASGVNLLWDFRTNDSDRCPEAVALWNLVQKVVPWVYIDFHCYTIHGATKIPGPYCKPLCFYYGEAAKACARQISQALLEIPNTMALRPSYYPSSSFYKLTEETNVITVAKYHLHLDWGKEKNKKLAWDVFDRVCRVLRRGGWTRDDILLKPYGKQKRSAGDKAFQELYRLRHVLLGVGRRMRHLVRR